jgi:hypothetical protein
MITYLMKASMISDSKQQQNKCTIPRPFLTLLVFQFSSSPDPVVEIDGGVAREFFSALNLSQGYTEDQQYNIFTFSILYQYILHMYFKDLRPTKDSNPTLHTIPLSPSTERVQVENIEDPSKIGNGEAAIPIPRYFGGAVTLQTQ